jgi:hypothetical protein
MTIPDHIMASRTVDQHIDHVCSLALGYGATGRRDLMADYIEAKEELRLAILAAVQEEREACARVCADYKYEHKILCDRFADLIRNRSVTEGE